MNVITVLIQSPPVDTPFVHDTENKVAKDGFHKQDLWEELQPNKDLVAIMDVVKDIQADGERHLMAKKINTSL